MLLLHKQIRQFKIQSSAFKRRTISNYQQLKMYTSNYSRNRNYSTRISSSQHRQSNHPRTRFSSISSNSEEIFQYKGSNKQQWAKLQNKIKQKMMEQNIWYLEDKDEVVRRSTPAPPISITSETPNQREDRLRLQKLVPID